MAGTSSFTEGASVFGGQANLLEAINNIFSIYKPDVIAVHTTCLSETIGDDIAQITAKAQEEGKIPPGKYVIRASTPSYVGSHVTGFGNMVKGMVEGFSAASDTRENQINIIPGFVEPSDMAEIKRILSEMQIKAVVFPDTSEVLNTPQTGKYEMYPKGGTTIPELRSTGRSRRTFALGPIASGPAAKLLDTKCKVPCTLLNLPIGLRNTDVFLESLRSQTGAGVSEALRLERGQLLDVITDMHQYLYGKKVALVGDPDHLVALTQFLKDLDMNVRHVVTGTPGKKFVSRIQEITGTDVNVFESKDMFHFHQLIKQERVDLILGNTYAKYISRDEDIPLVRTGFPIYDRIGHQYFPLVGYRGALRLVEKILSALMDRQDRDAPEESFELVM
jgi:nitrogenase molybdenum-iron protein beta chain